MDVLATVKAPANGIINYIDTTAGAGPRFYRLAVSVCP
jgi:hypothetical protein